MNGYLDILDVHSGWMPDNYFRVGYDSEAFRGRSKIEVGYGGMLL